MFGLILLATVVVVYTLTATKGGTTVCVLVILVSKIVVRGVVVCHHLVRDR